MKLKHIFFILTLIACDKVLADCNSDCGVSPTFVTRSQSRYKLRQDAGINSYSSIFNKELWNGHFAVIPGFMLSFAPNSIQRLLFGNQFVGPQGNKTNNYDTTCSGNTILIQGSTFKHGNRNPRAWLADNFYLAPDYNGQFTVTPRINDFLIDMDLRFGNGNGWYGRIYAPIVNTHWTLEFSELVGSSTQGYTIGYFDSVPVINANLLQSFGSYAQGDTPCFGTSVTPNGLAFAKISKCKHTKSGIADIRFELGWNFITDCYEMGLNIQGAAPTGNKRSAEFLFEPIVGNGKHWELGMGLTAYRLIWQDTKEKTQLGFYVDANITHLFSAAEQRTFDLRNKPSSRYMLALQMSPANAEVNLQGNPFPQPVIPSTGTLAEQQFNGIYMPLANLTTFNVNVSVGVQADIVAWFTYSWDQWSWDFGYNFYGRTTENFDVNLDNRCNANSICANENRWALKGDARVFGFATTSTQPIFLSPSENCATINQGTNELASPCVVASPDYYYQNNCGVDNAQYAVIQQGISAPARVEIAPGFNDNAHQVLTSIQPVFISCADIDFARTKTITNGLFLHLNYTWIHECYVPFFGIGCFAEFGKNCDQCSGSCYKSCPDTCPANSSIGYCPTNCFKGADVDTSLSRWGAWVKTGVAF